MYEIEVQYDETQQRAEFDCPLCNSHWTFPFPARKILDVPQPGPHFIVVLHLYGCGPGSLPCVAFDQQKLPHVTTVSRTRAKLKFY
jgi:hypothetical protein